MWEKFEMLVDAFFGAVVMALMFVFAIGFLVSLLSGNWNAATAFGVGVIGILQLVE